MENVPSYTPIVFGAALIAAFVLIWLSHAKNKIPFIFWLIVGGISSYLAYTGFFLNTDATPPRLLMLLIPSALLPLLYLFTAGGKKLIHDADDGYLHYIHGTRVAVEFVLLWLHKAQYLPVDVTFEGRNYDIVIGMTAPLIAHMGYQQKLLTRNILIGWNVIGMLSLLNVVIHAALSLPGPMQVINFEMPNTAVLYFPFQLLPTVLVPMILYCHIVSILRLVRKEVEVETPDED